ncbi:MAG TPA: 30S ribosomal protein S9 [Bacteroidetes bacterium]|nr:30S ribosomal protein S9 [Bacteroidota bacterium]HEX05215.1 30S ribosomal protein S9 [Bacteroidota bacterium]
MAKIPANSVYATGRRKTSVAKVWLAPGSGNVVVNGRTMLDHFKREILLQIIQQPLAIIEGVGKYDIYAVCHGGGLSGQAGAIRLGITRCLVKTDEKLRSTMRKAGYITRDPREKERKKYGQPGARKKFQFSKR